MKRVLLLKAIEYADGCDIAGIPLWEWGLMSLSSSILRPPCPHR